MHKKSDAAGLMATRHGLARVISKLGVGSRTQGAQWARDGLVKVNGRVIMDPEFPVWCGRDKVEVRGKQSAATRRVLMLNKPRGLVTTARDEQGRETVYKCLEGAALGWLAPVGRLDKASEGLLLFSNDPQWSALVTDPGTGPCKTYHVQVDCRPDEPLLAKLQAGVMLGTEHLSARIARCLRVGEKNAWLEIVLDEGRNRQIRRLLAALDISVLRLVRVAIGSLALGELAKGQWRELNEAEIFALTPSSPQPKS